MLGFAAALELSFMVWLVIQRIWWGLAAYIAIAVFGLSVSAFQLKDNAFVCPKCNKTFKPPMRQAFFSTGDHKVRWIACPVCGDNEWCVMQKEKSVRE